MMIKKTVLVIRIYSDVIVDGASYKEQRGRWNKFIARLTKFLSKSCYGYSVNTEMMNEVGQCLKS